MQKSNHPFSYEPISKYSNGQRVLYYIGPQPGINGKWHQRWTGPWTITRGDGIHHVIISNKKGKTCKVSIDRLKIFKQKEMKEYMNWNEFEQWIQKHQSTELNLDDEN